MRNNLFFVAAGLFYFLCVAGTVSAVNLTAYTDSFNSTSIQWPENGTQTFYTSLTGYWASNTVFYYHAGVLKVVLLTPSEVIDSVDIPILCDRAFRNETDGYTVETGIPVSTISLTVISPPEGDEESDDEDCTISISVIGRAFYGKNLLVHTTDDDYKDIIANVVGQDGAGNSLICQTNNPFKGYCNIFIPEDAEPDITLLANKEGCTTGQYIINKLEGQKLTPEDEEAEPSETLEIVGLPQEALINSMINGSVLIVETGEVVDRAEISITDPLNGKVTTHSSNGLFKVYARELGSYTIHAKLEDHTQSENYTVVVRNPREEIDVVVMIGNKELETVYVGDTVDIVLYSDNNLINETVTGTVKCRKSAVSVAFTDGWIEYTIEEEGIIDITVDQSENFLAAETSIEAVHPASWEIVGWAALITFVIIGSWLAIKKRRKGGSGVPYGTPPSTEPFAGRG